MNIPRVGAAKRRRRTLTGFATVLVPILVIAACSRASDPVPTVEAVLVRVSGCSLVDSLAVGVRAGSGRVVTVAHTLRGAKEATIDGKPAAIVAIDHRRDLAVLQLAEQRDPEPAFGMPNSGPAVLKRIDEVGAEESVPIDITKVGLIDMEEPVDTTTYRRDGIVLVSTASVSKGNSGAPIIDLSGRIVGMLFATQLDSGPNAFAVAASEIEGLLAEAGTEPVPTGACG